tara:strand:- start:586 stop:882 length:297 start_codon:yes stop_codon:yes gene_type:complete
MKYPVNFSNDLKELSKIYEWDDDEKKEIKKWFTGCPATVNYLTVLAAAHRAGYKNYAAGGFQTLQKWCLDVGVGDPFAGGQYDLKALDALEVKPRQSA